MGAYQNSMAWRTLEIWSGRLQLSLTSANERLSTGRGAAVPILLVYYTNHLLQGLAVCGTMGE